VKRLEALRLSVGSVAMLATNTAATAGSPRLALPQFSFAIGIGSNRGVGVLFDVPALVVQEGETSVKQSIIPRAELQGERRWNRAVEPAVPPTTVVSGPPNNDVIYGPIRDRATALCLATRGVYIGMLAFPTLPYLVHCDVDKHEFRTYALPWSDPVMVVFERPGRLYYVLAGATELRSVDLATA
jgi:hypothetical protein